MRSLYTEKLLRADPFTAPLRLVPQCSVRCLRLIASLHALLAIAVLLNYPLSGASVGVSVGIAFSAYWTHREFCAAPRAFGSILYDGGGRWWVTDHAGERITAVLTGAPLRTRWLVLLPLAVAGQRYTVALTADVTPPDLLRRLRVRLRYAWSTRATTSAAE
jgi:hypothetical protein